MRHTVLICDDDEDILNALDIYLRGSYDLIKAKNGKEALEKSRGKEVHLFLLDVMMPVMDGITAASKLRERTNAPVIFLSAKSEDTDRILGLDIGADDYVTKPFNPVELVARIRAHLRRYLSLGGIAKPEQGVFRSGGLVLDDNKKQVTVDGDEACLTAIEFNILKLLMSSVGRVFSSTQIYEQVWGEPAIGIGKIVAVHIRHIREKIEINPKEPRYVVMVYGLGYKAAMVE
jgi:DNA-binding response OmpR family regulator